MKKRNLLVTLACSTLLLTSCNKITATLPEDLANSHLTNASDKGLTLDHDTLDTIYNTIKGGDSYTSNVNQILTQAIAKEVFGEYKVVADKEAGYKIILVGYDNETDAKKEEFISKHPAYNNWESSSYKLKISESKPSKADFERRVNIIKDLIDSKIVSTLWSEANATAYKRNNRFYEVLYARNLDEKLFNVTDLENKTIGADIIGNAPDYTAHYIYDGNEFNGFKNEIALRDGLFTEGVLIDSTFDINYVVEEKEGENKIIDGVEKIKSVLHIGYYTDYINSSIMPTIMKNLLVEQYILEESYNSIGQTNSRKVNYINVSNNADKDGDKFFNKFVSTYFTGSDEANLALSTTEKFAIASEAWKGNSSVIANNPKALDLATSVFGTASTENPSKHLDGHDSKNDAYIQQYKDKKIEYYKNTPYADLVEEYSTLTNDILTNNVANYDKFTTIDSINYDPIVGLSIQEDTIKVNDYTTYGWQTNDSTSLPEDVKGVLFSYGFITEWNRASSKANDDKSFLGTYLYEVGNTGKYLLKTSNFNNAVNSVLWQNGGNYYIIEVEDVITADKCQINPLKEGATEAEKIEHTNKNFDIEAKSRDAAYTLASGSTFTTNAIVHYLEQCNINYHDQDVYDYFVSTYPKLFK